MTNITQQETWGIIDRIRQEFNSTMEELCKDVERNVKERVDQEKKNFGIRVAAAASSSVTRAVRRETIERYISVKGVLQRKIFEKISSQPGIDEIHDMKEMRAKIKKNEANIVKLTRNIQQIEASKNENEYVKYEQQKNADYVKAEHINHRQGLTVRQILGLIVTLLCAGTDFFMLYTVFISGNLSLTASMASALIFSLVLDVPPYILGWIIASRSDHIRLSAIKGESSVTAKYNLSMILIIIVLLLAIGFYVLVRIISFLGSGDFSEAFILLINREFRFQDGEFSASELLSSIVPIATSAVSFVMGLFLGLSKVDFLQDISISINKSLDDDVKQLRNEIDNCQVEIDIMKLEYGEKKQEVWSRFYANRKEMEKTEEKFFAALTNEYSKSIVKEYREIYRDCCVYILSKAEEDLPKINEGLARETQRPDEIRKIDVDADEREQLRKIWVTGLSTENSDWKDEIDAQHPDTKRTMEDIEKRVKDMVKTLSG